jgi:DnaJ-class molecular chaperone
MEQVTDYYAVLGVEANAPTEVIKKAFKHLALQYHPDIYKGEDAEERMREILLAYQTLIDPERRRTYELSRSQHMPGSFMPTGKNTDVSPTAPHARQRSYAFPVLNEGTPVQIVRRAIGASTCCCAASTAMLSSKASKFVTRLARCTMVTARSARPTNCSPCVPTVAKPSGVLPRKRGCGTCETRRREWQNGGGDSDLSDSSNLVVTHNEGMCQN